MSLLSSSPLDTDRFIDKPSEDPEAIGDPYKTLFISRLVCIYPPFPVHSTDILPQHKNATENELRREFEGFGSIERVRIVRDKNGRSRGYAFIVFERERDMKGNSFLAYYRPTHPACICAFTPWRHINSSCLQGVRSTSYHGETSPRRCRTWSHGERLEATPSWRRIGW